MKKSKRTANRISFMNFGWAVADHGGFVGDAKRVFRVGVCFLNTKSRRAMR